MAERHHDNDLQAGAEYCQGQLRNQSMSARFQVKALVWVCGLASVIFWLHGFEIVSSSDWREGAEAGVPKHQGVAITTTTSELGQGATIRTGDLVRVSIRELPEIAPGTLDMFVATNEPPSHGDGWLYMGNLNVNATKFGPTFVHTINRTPRPHSNYGFGSGDFRAALTGARAGSVLQLAIALPAKHTSEMFATGMVGVLPANGFQYEYDLYSQFVDPLTVLQPTVRVTYGHRYEVTVREGCPARLLVQDVTMTQHGPRMICTNNCIFCCSLSLFRQAQMQFALMDGKCAGGKSVHLGPIAVIDKDVTRLPREFEEPIQKRIRRLSEHWPVQPLLVARDQVIPRSGAHEESDIERRVREAEERANGQRP
jgi:hypothetical protein